jgi:hypothetical protein
MSHTSPIRYAPCQRGDFALLLTPNLALIENAIHPRIKTITSSILLSSNEILGSLTVRAIGILASWQVMIGITLAPMIYTWVVGDELEIWCKESILGNASTITDTWLLNQPLRDDLITAQENKLNLALHHLFGTPKNHKPTQREIEQKKLLIERINKSAQKAALDKDWNNHD